MTGGQTELAELLRRAGLEVTAERWTDNVPRPWCAWRPLVAYEAVPTVAVRADRPDLVAALNAQWHRLAVAHKVLGEDGEFLISVAGTPGDSGARHWTRVRLTAHWDLAGVLGDRPGQPEFVTLSPDGAAMLGVTCEEYEIWLIAEGRFGARRAEAAEAAARETPKEREAAWGALSRGLRPPERLRRAWADGLALNPAAPEDVLRGLLGLSSQVLRRKLPNAVVDAALAHPQWQVRGLLAEAQPHLLTAQQWTRLLLDEPDRERRYALAALAADKRAEFTDIAYERLATDPDPRVRAETARFPGLPARLLTALATDPDPRVRTSACPPAWPHLDAPAREVLLADPDDSVRTVALLRHHEDRPLRRSAFAMLVRHPRGRGEHAAERCRLDRALAEHLALHDDPALRRALAKNPHLDADLVTVLAQDPADDVRLEVSVRPELTEEQRAAIRIDFSPGLGRHTLPWVAALHDDPDAMRRCATSSHPLLRSSAARAKRLPPDVAERLARDEDRVVRLFLAESCDDAPADMLLEVWGWWTGSFSHPGRPRTHPNFPQQGLLRHADAPNPRMRQLALDDPESAAALVERFSRDTDTEVRLRAATDPRLPAAAAVWLLDDPQAQVRRAAARHPHLPARALIQLLRDTETADHAARNPALPASVMRQLLARATDDERPAPAGGRDRSPGPSDGARA
ncbi:PE-PGRS family protein [Streptomyces sp. NPDC048483]|uniref:PE-PGRS family protein n=1 Tax=Streptomyces sp. NPDC048483 TaxID=3154927 RepID=UPI00341F3C45